MFQVGVAQLAKYSAEISSFAALVANAFTAGLLHDLGKLFWLRIYPYAFQAIVAYARKGLWPCRRLSRDSSAARRGPSVTTSPGRTTAQGLLQRHSPGWKPRRKPRNEP